MRWFRFAVLVLVAAVVQTGFAGLVSIIHQDVRLDLLVILLVFFAIHCDGQNAVIASFAIGLAADLANPAVGFMGPKIISFGLLGTLLSDMNGLLSIRKMVHQAVAIFAMGVLTFLLSFLLAYLRTKPTTTGLDRELFWQPLLSGIVGPFLFVPMAWWMRMNKRRRRYVR